jgi:hypothetical protein
MRWQLALAAFLHRSFADTIPASNEDVQALAEAAFTSEACPMAAVHVLLRPETLAVVLSAANASARREAASIEGGVGPMRLLRREADLVGVSNAIAHLLLSREISTVVVALCIDEDAEHDACVDGIPAVGDESSPGRLAGAKRPRDDVRRVRVNILRLHDSSPRLLTFTFA